MEHDGAMVRSGPMQHGESMEQGAHDRGMRSGGDTRGMNTGTMGGHHGLAPGPDVALVGPGVWLAWGPAGLGHAGTPLVRSAVASGLALALIGVLALLRGELWATWAGGAVRAWVLFAPMVFWTGGAARSLQGTIIGALAIARPSSCPTA